MASVYDVNEKMHKMRVKLYPNYLPGGEGTYIARTASEASVNIRDIVAAMKNRGGFQGSVDEAVEIVTWFLKEMGYQIADGFAVNLGFFSVHPNVGGVFHSEKEPCDPKKHPISFRFQALSAMLQLRNDIEVIIEGIADANAYIGEFVDLEENSVNHVYVHGNGFAVHGRNIKIEGSDPRCGMYFVSVEDPAKRVKVERIFENNPSKVMGLIPKTDYLINRIEIVTQFINGGHFLSAPRTITSPFTVEET